MNPAQFRSSRLFCQKQIPSSDIFPAPGRSNRLPDWQQRYEDLLAVVDAGGFDPEQQANLVRLVMAQFAPVVPEAQTAAGVPSERN